MNHWNSGSTGFSGSGHDHSGDYAGTAELAGGVDAVEAYFECISTCSLDDAECITVCTTVLRDHN